MGDAVRYDTGLRGAYGPNGLYALYAEQGEQGDRDELGQGEQGQGEQGQGEQGQGNQESGLTEVCPLTGEVVLTDKADRIVKGVCQVWHRHGWYAAWREWALETQCATPGAAAYLWCTAKQRYLNDRTGERNFLPR